MSTVQWECRANLTPKRDDTAGDKGALDWDCRLLCGGSFTASAFCLLFPHPRNGITRGIQPVGSDSSEGGGDSAQERSLHGVSQVFGIHPQGTGCSGPGP